MNINFGVGITYQSSAVLFLCQPPTRILHSIQLLDLLIHLWSITVSQPFLVFHDLDSDLEACWPGVLWNVWVGLMFVSFSLSL